MGLTYLDSCLLIYALEEKQPWSERSTAAIKPENEKFAISPLVKLECLVGPFKQGDKNLENRFHHVFDSFELLDLSDAVYLYAAEIRARFGLKTPDALHLACAQHHRCDALWTNDARLDKASGGMARNIFA